MQREGAGRAGRGRKGREGRGVRVKATVGREASRENWRENRPRLARDGGAPGDLSGQRRGAWPRKLKGLRREGGGIQGAGNGFKRRRLQT